MARRDILQQIAERLEAEQGTIFKTGATRFALVKPSTYAVSMSSLGLQQIYRMLNAMPDVACERAFLPDDPTETSTLLTYESRTAVGDFDLIGLSVAYELEICGIVRCLELAGLPPLAADRGEGYPLVVLGGPLTFSNPLPAAPFADVLVMGEGEELIQDVVRAYQGASSRSGFLDAIEGNIGIYIPEREGERLVTIAKADNVILPAYSVIRTPHTELRDMHLVESERGCHRKCTFCVMRRSTNGGMRLASPERILETVPEDARRVGLVGAAVSDHPRLVDVVGQLVDRGCEVGLSSLRADRLSPELLRYLVAGGARTITVASDGASERLRKLLEKNIRAKHLRRAAELSAEAGVRTLKVYMMVGVPEETPEDIEELVAFTRELSKTVRVALGIAPFVAKRNTPLDRTPFAGIKAIDRTLAALRKQLRGAADIRSVSARWAWVEYHLAQGGFEMASAAIAAYRGGESFAAWRRAIREARAARPLEDVPGLYGLAQPAVLAV